MMIFDKMNFMHKKNFFLLIAVAFVLASCQQESQNVVGGDELHKPIELTPEEYASIAYSGDNDLSEEDIITIVKDFSKHASIQSSNDLTFSIEKRVKVDSPNTTATNNPSAYVYYVNITNGSEKGIALVSGDKRFPEVLSYCLKVKVDDFSQNEGVQIMNEIAKQTMLNEIAYYKHLRDSLEETTLARIAKQFGKSHIEFNEIEEKIYIKNYERTRTVTPQGTLVSQIGPFTNTEWDQAYPYNAYLDETDAPIFANSYYNHRFATGCVITAGAQILAYYQPTVVAYGVNMDWRTLLQSKYIFEDEYTKVNQVANLMKYIGAETGTEYKPTGSSTSVEKLTSFLNRYGITMDGSVNGMSVARIKASLDAVRMVVATGKHVDTRSANSSGGHSWLLDGYQIRKKNTREILKTNHIYVHANMGWGGDYSGYYIVGDDQSLPFDTGNGLYDTNLKIYCNVKSTR